MNASRLARIMKVLSVPARVRIVELLRGRTLCVNALAGRLGVSQSAVSQHLRVMRDAGLVTDHRRGYFVHYRLDPRTLAAWRGAIEQVLSPAAEGGCENEGSKSCAAKKRKTAASRKS